jgi:hypothetical protein
MRTRSIIVSCIAGIIIALSVSCSTIGQYMPMSSDEIAIGTIQTTFVARDTWLSNKDNMNTQAYVKLLEAAAQKYSGEIDIREIMWVTGRKISPLETEISATAKVIRVDTDETGN